MLSISRTTPENAWTGVGVEGDAHGLPGAHAADGGLYSTLAWM